VSTTPPSKRARRGATTEAVTADHRTRAEALADPNCVERAALYISFAELIDPQPVRRLATVATTRRRNRKGA